MDLDDFSGLKKKKKKKKKPFDMEGLEDALTVGFLILSSKQYYYFEASLPC